MSTLQLLRVLLLEDRPDDAALIVDHLHQAGFSPTWQRVDTEPEYLAHLNPFLDIILADHGMPQFDSLHALRLLQERGWDIPFIIVSGTIGEDAAVAAMKQGAADYLLKDRLARLGEAVRLALRQKQLRDEQHQAIQALRESEERFRALIEHGTDIIAVAEADGTLRYISPSVERVLGYTPDELTGQAGFAYLHPADLEQAHEAQRFLLTAPGLVSPQEFRVRHKDGSIRVLEIITSNQLENPSVRGLVVNARDITDRKRAGIELSQSQDLTSTLLSHQLVQDQEAERRRLAQELHDQVGQNLTALGINLSVLLSQLPARTAKKVRARLQDCLQLVNETVRGIRDVMAELRPAVLDDYGLAAALRWYGEQFSQRTGLEVVVQDAELTPPLPSDVETALFRITQEALTNVAKHAGARQVRIILEIQETIIRLTIADDGVGFVPSEQPLLGRGRGVGLISMQERATAIGGHLQIQSVPGQGTRIVVELAR